MPRNVRGRPRPVGRPSEYDPSFCGKMISLGKQGMGVEEIALEWEICKQTIYNWTKAHPEFLDAFNTAMEFSKAWWMKEGRTSLRDKEMNARMYEIQVMNRIGWSRKNDDKQEHTGSVTIVTKIPTIKTDGLQP